MAATLVCAAACLGAAPQPPLFEDLSPASGLATKTTSQAIPLWVDMDGDGAPEPLWISPAGPWTLTLGEGGVPVLTDVDAPLGTMTPAGQSDPVAAVADFDDDGADEILVINRAMVLLRPDGPTTLVRESAPLPTLPGASALDAAVGDLNGDGLPDLIVGFGIYATERLELRGYPDQVFMNLGHGRFERHTLEPSREAFSNGLTLVDMDGDGRPDLVESVDASPLMGWSRILWNRTPPGDRVPVFQVAPETYDRGTFGMGAAVDDIDGDGHIDIYNTSVGLELLAMGQGDGSYTDETLFRGLRHEWGAGGLRMQWSATFGDLNADGLLDLVVRQGGMGVAGGFPAGPLVSGHESDLLYHQDGTGGFLRSDPPYDPLSSGQGRQAVLGDLDRDGLPDVALGGQGGAASFWRNVTPVPASTRRFTLAFEATVSASPPIGAKVTAHCDGVSFTRLLTSGGKMGASAAAELALAWTACETPPTVDVAWPSGARSSHVVPAGLTRFVAAEPAWWTEGASLDMVVLDPTDAGAQEACLGSAEGSWTCCALADAPCTLSVADEDGRPLARLDDRLPVALPARTSAYVILTEPHPPRPGESVTLHVLHLGPAAKFDPTGLSLFVGGDYRPWENVDTEMGVLTTTQDVGGDATSLPVTLFPLDVHPTPTWSLPVSAVFDPALCQVDVYPFQVIGGVTEFWQWAAYATVIRAMDDGVAKASVILSRLDGTPLATTNTLSSMTVARIRVLAPWEDMGGDDALVLSDGTGGFSVTLPAIHPLAYEDATAAVSGTFGGIVKPRMVEDGDVTTVLFRLLDDQGRSMPPEPEMVTLEADGAEILTEVDVIGGPYNLNATIRTTEGTTPGQVRILAADGRLVSTYGFTRRPKGQSGVSLDDSWAEAQPVVLVEHPGASHAVQVHAHNVHGDVLGASADVDLELTGGHLVRSLVLQPPGYVEALVGPDVGQGEITIDVFVDGDWLTTLVVTAAAPVAEPPGGDLGPDAGGLDPFPEAAPDAGPPSAEDEPPPGRPGCGCQGASPSGDPWLALAALLWLGVRGRRREENVLCG